MTAPILAELIERATGLAIERGGVSTALDRFVTERQHALKIARLEDYIALAADPSGTEQRKLIDAITVPHSWFYRDAEQLQTIAKLISAMPNGPVWVWVAGCATGEEAYTLAMIGHHVGREVSVVATDINENALAAARRGVYAQTAVRDVPPRDLRRWLGERDGSYVVDPTLRERVAFVRHNLVDAPPSPARGAAWDLVICRNVLIYFSPRQAQQLLLRFARSVREGGSLVVGASEVVFEPPAGLELVSVNSRLVLRRTAGPAVSSIRKSGALPALTAQAPAPTTTVARPARAQTEPPVLADDLVSILNRGHVLWERGEAAAAIGVYTELSISHPSVAEVWLFLGIARYFHREDELAAHALRSCLCLDPALWPANFYLARALERLGRLDEALQQYELLAVDELPPLALQSTSALINEMHAFRSDWISLARRLTTPPRRPLK